MVEKAANPVWDPAASPFISESVTCFFFVVAFYFFKQLDAGAFIPQPQSTFKDCEGARICMNTASVYSTENRRCSVR